MPAWKDWRGWSFIAGHFENLGRFSNPPPPPLFTVLHPSFLEMTLPKILLVVKVNLPPPPPTDCYIIEVHQILNLQSCL